MRIVPAQKVNQAGDSRPLQGQESHRTNFWSDYAICSQKPITSNLTKYYHPISVKTIFFVIISNEFHRDTGNAEKPRWVSWIACAAFARIYNRVSVSEATPISSAISHFRWFNHIFSWFKVKYPVKLELFL